MDFSSINGAAPATKALTPLGGAQKPAAPRGRADAFVIDGVGAIGKREARAR